MVHDPTNSVKARACPQINISLKTSSVEGTTIDCLTVLTCSLTINWWLCIMSSNLSQRACRLPICSIPPPATDRISLFLASAASNSGNIYQRQQHWRLKSTVGAQCKSSYRQILTLNRVWLPSITADDICAAMTDQRKRSFYRCIYEHFLQVNCGLLV